MSFEKNQLSINNSQRLVCGKRERVLGDEKREITI